MAISETTARDRQTLRPTDRKPIQYCTQHGSAMMRCDNILDDNGSLYFLLRPKS